MHNICRVCGWPQNRGPHNHRLVAVEEPIYNEQGKPCGIRLTFKEPEEEPRLPFESG